ncbi:3-keto-5-aminohexanoate cleavage enzyme [Ralstonia condita]|uniref:3-keto-5-aminohexanoate cleavage enzyme n=1 Tax=Ralstonia condita TaxID=3058600 RepID=A0ABM9JDN3_9RALS|nr:3-keto-5-aminohexanoate cleavage protein [Ralstonia sp. LMG 7141]CAJ0790405.1 3-keto-5-aminohexanoate cleavage enzyme [Ralstonia sp. LMG 7141]
MKLDVTRSEKVIITVATTGGLHGKEANPNLPEQPGEIVQAMQDAYNAGASVAHIHVRDKQGLTTADLDTYSEVVGGINSRCPGMITQVGNGIGARYVRGRQYPAIGFTQEQRMALLDINPRPDMLTVNAGSFHFQHKFTEVLFDNSKAWNTEFINGCNERGIHNELEVYDLSHIDNMIKLRDRGVLKGPMHFSLVLGIDGGVPASPKNLMILVDALPEGSSWQVVTIGKHQIPLSMMALAMGGNIRVGFEDNVYIEHGVLAVSNAQFVEKAVRIARELGREIATPEEAREMMGMHQAKTPSAQTARVADMA